MGSFLSNAAEIHFKSDGTCSMRLVELSLSKKLIQIESKKEYSGSLEEVLKNDFSGPLALTITGKGLLVKKTARLEQVTEQGLQHLFPQMKLSEFYVQHFPTGTCSFIAVIRKEIVNAMISAFKLKSVDIVLLSLGPFVVDQVVPQINSYGAQLKFDGHHITFDGDKNWQEYSFSAGEHAAFPLKIDIESIPEKYLLAYASAFQFTLHEQLNLIEVLSAEIKQNLVDYAAKLKFKKHGMLILLFFFVLLMLNFLVFNYYNSDNQELMSKAGQKSYVFENRQKMEEDVKVKEGMVQKLGWNKGYSYAYLCDQLGQTLPKEIKLEEMQINSLYGTGSGLLKAPQLDNGSMRIKGQTSSVYAVNDWIYTLKEKQWVKEVKLEKYMADDQKGAQVFTLFLSY
ncbi:Fimbrial assembly protein (PilN) [Pedobacter steynii]|uniref:Fimbrial assembly protein (PilN) n=1 Tax=Pedobacter steynii TaxID=430522 RepID=A0A1H0ALM0_9SPHI|nr:PilN domain-containing protein [Pedobacter steynii]NQX41320.1 PilN domain-containing protein [Pedobacter steynii]SDN34468.1 Fimbrial assembly protein (PilN) [Pedobacter steynii]